MANNPVSNEDFNRSFGQLEGKVDAVALTLIEIKQVQQDQIDKAERGRRRLHKRLDELATQVTAHKGKLEELEDRVDGQGTAITEIETTQEASKALEAAHIVTTATNRKWIVGLASAFGITGSAVADHATQGKISKFLVSFFK